MKRVIVFLLLSAYSIFAGNTGNLEGYVRDVQTGEALIGANILIDSTTFGASTNQSGYFFIENVPEGKYKIKARYIGYAEFIFENIKISKNKTTSVLFELQPETYQTEAVIVVAPRPLIRKSITNSTQIVNMPNSISVQAGVVENRGTPHNTEEYVKISENTFYQTIESPLSTFAADVDNASYSNVRQFINNSRMPFKDAVRCEEMINYFSYNYEKPTGDHPLSINLEYSDCPWNSKNKLVNIGLKGKELSAEETKANNLVFLIDVSGSMNQTNKLPLLKKAFKLLVNNLKDNDRISIVVYASKTGLVLPATSGSESQKIIDVLDNLQAGGSTAGGAGIQLAYKIAKENFIEDGNNRVILATDGDFNVGVSSTSELVRLVEEKKEDGIFLTILGFGMGNYKDYRLQELADKGNGTHYYIDNIMEAKKILGNELRSTLFTIAKDVKIQVEFNPTKVASYRLLGYENRKLENKDFKDDTKDAGEIGSGHTVTALYEIVPVDEQNIIESNDLKYQETKIKSEAYSSNEILTVKVRYKDPDGDTSKEISKTLENKIVNLDDSSENFKFSAAVAEFAMLLFDSEFKGSSNFEQILSLAKNGKGDDKFNYREEFISLVEKAQLIKQLD